ncbi:hypothetical protein [uncultured Maribacter sp.]|uniref:hypothetical protein n=1 Tax=uncultured Maribacter sp. TaxID=431308 RepID=UPI0026399521|nr:hypothetical protein [uncultured Maribacter sp.]
MIVNRTNKTALIEKGKSFNGKGLFFLNFDNKTSRLLQEYEDWEPITISDNSELLILKSQWISHRGTNKTELIILNIKTEEIIFSTKDYLVYDSIFDKRNNRILLDVYNKKLFSLDLRNFEKTELPKKELRICKGTFIRFKNEFYVPSETKKKCIFCFSFETGETDEILIDVIGKIEKIKFLSREKTFVLLSSENILYSFSNNFNTKNWQIDFKQLEDKPNNISRKIFSSESQDLIFLSASSTIKNNWGVDYCIDLKNGNILSYINNVKGRGRIAEHFFENQVLLHSGKTMDMISGKIGESEVIKTIAYNG